MTIKNTVEWLNTRDLYVDYCHITEMAPLARTLLEQYKQFFDDSYIYWQPNDRHKKLLPLVNRRPIWMMSKRMPAEKFHMRIDSKKLGQTKL